MASSITPKVTYADNNWMVAWPDDYHLLIKSPDESRPGVFRAETVAFHGDEQLTIATIDFLHLRDRESFHISASGVNGMTPISWEDRLQQAYSGIQAQATTTTRDAWPALQPLPSLLPDVPSLPSTMLPAGLRPWMEDVAERMQVPLEYVAIPALVALGAVV